MECSYKKFQSYFNPRFPWGKRPLRSQCRLRRSHFNPRFPWGKRPQVSAAPSMPLLFQSTLPVGEATFSATEAGNAMTISIHASRGGSDLCDTRPISSNFLFQSTLPVGEATGRIKENNENVRISIHASRGGSDGTA